MSGAVPEPSADRTPPPLMPAGLLAEFLEMEGGEVAPLDLEPGAPLAGHVVTQDGCDFLCPAIDHHFIEIALEGRAEGILEADGLVTGYEHRHVRGHVSYLPRGRAVRANLRGKGRYLQVLIADAVMVRAKDDLLHGGAAGGEMLGFNPLMVPELRDLLAAVDPARPPARLALDLLARRLCEALVRDFSTGRLARPGPAPGLSRAQVMRAIDLIEACLGMDLTLAMLADALELPEGAFAAGFEAETGLDPAAYLAERRVDRVIEWIEEGEGAPVDAARLARTFGFADGAAMDAALRARTGLCTAALHAALA